MSDLDLLIRDFAELANCNLEKEINAIFAEIMRVIGIKTINDTNQAKSIFVDATRQAFGIDISDVLGIEYNFWGNKDRKEGSGKFSFMYTNANGDAEFVMTANDDGLYFQEYPDANSNSYPSEYHAERTGRGNSKFEPEHIMKTCDNVNAGKIKEVNEKIKKFEEKIRLLLEGE